MSLLDKSIYDLCLEHHRDVRELDFVVGQSLPIPFFGDVAACLDSPVRIITAALNPSNQEFPVNKTRFNVTRGLTSASKLEEELSAYFKRNPYHWFGNFEHVLRGMDCSYGGRMADRSHVGTALHLDMCSPIATSPTWSKLTLDHRATLTATGRRIFQSLIDALRPDVVLASLSWSHIQEWHSEFLAGRSWDPVLIYTTAHSGKKLRAPLMSNGIEC